MKFWSGARLALLGLVSIGAFDSIATAAPGRPFAESGIIVHVDLLDCVVFQSDLGGLYHLDDAGGFGIGDEVCVEGIVTDDGCRTGCEGPVFVRCVAVETIRACEAAAEYIDECGTLIDQTGDLPGVVCRRFLTDDGRLYLVGDLGAFTVGDRAHVTGAAQGPCFTLVCGGAAGCMVYNGIRACAGDLNADGHVDGLDLALLLGQWTGAAQYAPCPPIRPADLNEDCRVDGLDLAMLLGHWTG